MSGECYSTKDLVMDISSTRKDDAVIAVEKKPSDHQSNLKMKQLLEYEHVVTSAESKCSQLKGQLERIKQLYNNKTDVVKSPSLRIHKSGSKHLKGRESISRELRPKLKVAKMVRQNSRCISTDTTGAALGTINNILAGITKSIHIPDLIDQATPVTSTQLKSEHLLSQDQIHGVEDIKINAKSKPNMMYMKPKPKLKQTKTSRSRINAKTSSIVFKKPKKSSIKLFDKRNEVPDNQPQVQTKPGIPTMNKKSRRIVARSRYVPGSYFSKGSTGNQDLVELYHNDAVKESKSSDSDVLKKKPSLEKEPEKPKTEEFIPPLNIDVNENKPEQSKQAISSIMDSKNYAMPTISSRMKRVAKYYMNSFNITTIPFCAATSTNASHNIGINIQQVMNMVKTKQPAAKLSPTLAYNIALAAGKWDDNPMSLLISTVTSRTMSHCPLSKSTVNYHQLQEIAKTIPEETIDEVDENEETHSPATRSMIITGPSGDVRVTNRKQTVWAANTDAKTCTCLPQRGMEFQQIINKFNGSISKSKISKSASHGGRTRDHLKSVDSVPGCLKSKTQQLVSAQSECTPLHNKEQKLKEVLKKLHDEFALMSKTYDDLVKRVEDGTADPESNKQLEDLDKELNSKEEEIVMVMTLYKEVIALKQQVKILKDRSVSKDNLSLRTQSSKYSGYNNLTTAGLLNKLLHRIQHFQTHYKRN